MIPVYINATKSSVGDWLNGEAGETPGASDALVAGTNLPVTE